MNRSIKFILLLSVAVVCSCIQKDIYDTRPNDSLSKVVFSAEPITYSQNTIGTKADGDTFDPEIFENTIYNAYFMLFDNGGILRILESASVGSNGATVSYSMEENILKIFPNAKVCFLANVAPTSISTFITNQTTWNDIDNFYINVSYAQSTSTKCIGVPAMADLNGDGVSEYGLPMFGSQTMNSSNSNSSFILERLLARVELHISLGIVDTESVNNVFSQPQFGMELCQIYNIPKFIPLTPKTSTTYSNNKNSQNFINDSYVVYNLSQGSEKMMYYSADAAPEYKSIYFYTPEHTFGNIDNTNTVPSNKPDLVTNTMSPIYASISGYLVDGEGDSWELKYNIHFGGNNCNNFDLIRNKIYKNYIRIKGVSNGPEVDHRVIILDKIDELQEDLGQHGQSANCYMIGAAKKYMIPAYRGASDDIGKVEMCDVGTNVVLACDNPNITITIDEEKSKQSTIVFEVKSGLSLLSGNAVIARLNESGEIDWSWHLWFVPKLTIDTSNDYIDLGSNELSIGGVGTETMPDGKTMMNRNLGVKYELKGTENLDDIIQGAVDGIYYRYGHRAPYFTDPNKGSAYYGDDSNIAESWDATNGKSRMDPCPPGYRVPPISLWNTGTNSSKATKEHTSLSFLGLSFEAFRYWNRGDQLLDWFGFNDIYYPYAGYINTNNKLEKWVSDDDDEEKTFNYKTGLSHWSLPEYNPSGNENDMRFRKAIYVVTNMQLNGGIWAQSGGIEFGANVPIKIVRFIYNKKVKKGNRWSYDDTEYQISVEELQKLEDNPYRDMLDWVLDDLDYKYTISYNNNANLNTKFGYQVRCIQE